jgi:PAS domain S-box-containing protein
VATTDPKEARPYAPRPSNAQSRLARRVTARPGAPAAELPAEGRQAVRAEGEFEELWRAAFEANPTMYFIVDEAAVIVSVNRFGAQQLGYEVSELVGQPVLNVFCESDRAFVQDKANSCFADTGRTMRWEARKLRKDGKVLWVRETANAVMLRDRPVLLVACEDVTERRHAEEALRDSEERFRTLVQFSFDVYWETDRQHRFVRQEFGPTVEGAPPPGSELGKTRWEVSYLEPDEEAWRKHRETLDAHLPFRDFELARPLPDGSKRYVSVSGLPVFDDTGAFVGYRGVGRHITERKRAEELLRQGEQELRDIIETMPAIALVTDSAGDNAIGNRRWAEYTGLGRAGATSDVVHPDDAERYTVARRRSIANGEAFEQEARLRRFDGEYRWFLSRAVPMRDARGKVLKWYSVHTDIHDRKLAEEERAAHLWFFESMDLINRAMQGTNDLEQMMGDVLDAVLEIFRCDRAWLIYPCDPEAPSWRSVIERTRPQFPGAFDLGEVPIDPDMAAMFRRARAAVGSLVFGGGNQLQLRGALAERFGICSQMVVTVRPKVDRAYLFGLHQCSHARAWSEQERRLFDEIGRRLADALTSLLIFRSLRDSYAELRHAQEELSASELLTRNVFENSPDGMVVIGRDYRYQRVNPVYERTWKMPAERIVGLHVTDLFGRQVFEQTLRPNLDRCFAGEQVAFAEWFLNASGRMYYSVIYAPLRLGSEQVEAALAITRDLTDHMLASQALRDAEAALARVNRVTTLGVLTASIAHEVNQPLGAMVTSAAACTRWLAARPPDMEKARSALQRITADGKRAGQVVERIRALVNRQAPRRDRVDVNEAILEVIALTHDEMRHKAIALQTSLAADVLPIQGDRIQLQQVVLNLLVNAIEAIDSSGARPRELAIASARDGASAVTVEVRDSGSGVSAAAMDRLFEAFYTTKEDGIGMGLSISRSIIEAHGGRLWVTPNVPHGAAFRFSLPMQQPVP